MTHDLQSSSSKTTKPKKKPVAKAETQPSTSEMVDAALKSLNERKGSSLHAIKKYLELHYKVDTEKKAPFIKRYLKKAVESGKILQTKGKGANGSFKMPLVAAKKKKTSEKAVAKKPSKTKTGVSVIATPAFKKRASIAAKLKPKKLNLNKEASQPTEGSPEKKMGKLIKKPVNKKAGNENKKVKLAKNSQKKTKSPLKAKAKAKK